MTIRKMIRQKNNLLRNHARVICRSALKKSRRTLFLDDLEGRVHDAGVEPRPALGVNGLVRHPRREHVKGLEGGDRDCSAQGD